jgi:hypothetical protein
MDKKNRFFSFFKKAYQVIFKDDSLLGNLSFLVFAIVFIKFLLFPTLGFFLGTEYPVVAIVSGSMEHKIVNHNICGRQFTTDKTLSLDFDTWWEYCGPYYEKNYQLTKEEFSQFDYTNGLNIGDAMILKGKDPSEIEVGEILVFIPGDAGWFSSHGPVIHRVVKKELIDGKYYFTTKGDHNPVTMSNNNFETRIPEDRILAVGWIRIPYIGYFKYGISKALGQI